MKIRYQFYLLLLLILIILISSEMRKEGKQEMLVEIPAYAIRINTSSFGLKGSFLKEKMKQEYLPQYWEKCRMDQKHINPSCEDRLSELTTGQIDRIIDMEKIRTLLNDKKVKAKEVYFDYDVTNPNTHPHIYEANFLAKINAIAIKRNIRHEKSQGFDEYFGEEISDRNGDKQKKANQVPYKYLKKYKLDSKLYKRYSSYHAEDDDEKSIESIEDKIEDFEKRLEKGKQERVCIQLSKLKQEEKVTPTMRWFNGMSNHYLTKDTSSNSKQNNLERLPNFDIESEVRHSFDSHRRQQSFSLAKGKSQISGAKSESISYPEPFIRYRINRINRISTIK